MKLRVTVMLKQGVLDPKGKAIDHALKVQGYGGVRHVRVGQVIDLDLDINDTATAKKQASAMAETLLANTVIEDYVVEVLP